MTDLVIEAAAPADLEALLQLLAQNGLPPDGLKDHVASIRLARSGGQIVGCAGLELYGTAALLRSVAVARELRGRGLGQRLTQAVLDLAHEKGVKQVYLLTETAAGFFPRFGFYPTTRDQVPAAVQQSVEFTTACPASALVMVKDLAVNS